MHPWRMRNFVIKKKDMNPYNDIITILLLLLLLILLLLLLYFWKVIGDNSLQNAIIRGLWL